MFRKRAKLQPSTGSDKPNNLRQNNNPETTKRRSKVDISTNYENEDENEYMKSALGPRPRDKKKRTIKPNALQHLAFEEEASTEVTFRKPSQKPSVQIMNLEELGDDSDDEALEGIPTRREIDSIRTQRAMLQQQSDTLKTGFYNSSKKPVEHDERQYIKLLNKDDKHDLMEIIGGESLGTDNVRENYVDANLEIHGLEDERLALSKNDMDRDKQERKLAITNALKNDEGDEWEAHQLEKMDEGQGFVAHPILHENDYGLKDLVSELDSMLLSIQTKKKMYLSQRDTAQRENEKLSKAQNALLVSLQEHVA
ncbi:LAQU0S01e13190g1_1 [Lachancea quebecensis]|uniref:LAQU0S01e13190g1_1 n=1 Tax=Lachancea quebecensis TaxID=1654605 RepID=A0A0P1KMV3_9SACH|nr:LAQU0S01e13190g1_1 [Lachancea quebecensis]